MAQLSDDCFAFGGSMASLAETVARVRSLLSPVEGMETVRLSQADGRVLGPAVAAPFPLPSFTNSAVDGYAVRGSDLSAAGAPTTLRLAERITAGATAAGPVKEGHAARIFTGAPMPDGADTVFMQEDVKVEAGGRLVLPPGLKRGSNVRPAGEDVAQGELVLPAGRRLRPHDVALLAALGVMDVTVRRRVRVSVFSNGNEIVEPELPRGPAQLFDSNRYMLMAMLTRLGCLVDDLGILPDAPDEIAATLEKAATGADLILASGGVSTGEADHVKTAVERVGRLDFWRVAIKPGRPVAMGTISGAAFIGLPGNPVASFVTFARIARPAILALAGTEEVPLATIPVRAGFSYAKKPGRREYVRVSLTETNDGVPLATKFPREGAGLLSSLVGTDGLVELGEECDRIAPGEIVPFLSYEMLI